MLGVNFSSPELVGNRGWWLVGWFWLAGWMVGWSVGWLLVDGWWLGGGEVVWLFGCLVGSEVCVCHVANNEGNEEAEKKINTGAEIVTTTNEI